MQFYHDEIQPDGSIKWVADDCDHDLKETGHNRYTCNKCGEVIHVDSTG